MLLLKVKGALLEATYRSSGWTKGPAIHEETWWWNIVSSSVLEKQKQHKQGNTSNEKYLEAKEKARKTVYQTTGKAKSKRSGNVMQQDGQKFDECRIPKKMVKTNQVIISGQCIKK